MLDNLGRHPARRLARTLIVLAAIAALAAPAATAQAQQSGRVVVLGGLYSLTGDWTGLGQCSRVAMELAIEDVNRYLDGNAAGIHFAAAIEDTRLDPAVALEKARALRARGVQLLIGPQSSSELSHLLPFVEETGLLLVSQSSTAGSLAIAGDNVFRFTPSDMLEGAALVAMMWEDGIRDVVPVWRDDAGNGGLEAAARVKFTARGGNMREGVSYAAGTRDFRTTLAGVRSQLDQAIALHGAGSVGVYLAGFDEVAELLALAGTDPVLGSVRWYGSDGAALSDAVTGNRQAAEFAIRTGYANPVFGLDEGAREIWEPLRERMRARTDHEPDAFAYAVYDAVWVVARGYIASGATQDREQLKRAFTTAAASGYGATGWTVLNEAGDRRYGDFDFWAVRMEDGQPRWTKVARYESRTERLVR